MKFIVPFGPGAGADIGARVFAEKLTQKWGQPVVIENKPGGDSIVAIQSFLSANDDHVLLFGPSGNFTVHPFNYTKLPYNPADLVPIARASNTLIARGGEGRTRPTSNVKEFTEAVRAAPGKFNYGAVPGITEFIFWGYAYHEKLDIPQVPYRDINVAPVDLGEGRIQAVMASYAIVQPQINAGRIKLFVVNNKTRISTAPDMPTAREQGYPSLEMEGLVGLFGLKTMSSELKEKIAADFRAVDRRRQHRRAAEVHRPGDQCRRAEGVRRLDRGAAPRSSPRRRRRSTTSRRTDGWRSARRTVLARPSPAQALAGPAVAQSYPSRVIKLIVPYTAGSPNDVMARLLTQHLSPRLGQPIVIDNKPGGGTAIGTKAAIAAEPDGYTLLFISSAIVIDPAMKKLDYDPQKDLTPVSAVNSTSWLITVNPSLPVKTLPEFVAYSKAHPGTLNFAATQGTAAILVAERFKQLSGTDVLIVPYKGGTAAIPDFLGGRIQMLQPDAVDLDGADPRRQDAAAADHQPDALCATCRTCRPRARSACRS